MTDSTTDQARRRKEIVAILRGNEQDIKDCEDRIHWLRQMQSEIRRELANLDATKESQ